MRWISPLEIRPLSLVMISLLERPVVLSTALTFKMRFLVNVKRHLDLRHTAWRRWNTGKLEFAQQVVIPRACTLALKDLDKHAGLVVPKMSEDLCFLGWDGGVALDECRHHTPSRLHS